MPIPPCTQRAPKSRTPEWCCRFLHHKKNHSESLISVRIPSAFFARMMSIPPVMHHVYPMCWSTFCKSVDVRLMVSRGSVDWLHTYGAFARWTIEVPVQSPACETRRDEVQGEVDQQKWHHHSPSHAERHRCKCKWPLIADDDATDYRRWWSLQQITNSCGACFAVLGLWTKTIKGEAGNPYIGARWAYKNWLNRGSSLKVDELVSHECAGVKLRVDFCLLLDCNRQNLSRVDYLSSDATQPCCAGHALPWIDQ